LGAQNGPARGERHRWQDTRVADEVARFAKEGGQDRFRAKTGLPLSTYFSGLKLRWILQNVPGARERPPRASGCSGISTRFWREFDGRPGGGAHVTDATNASRTQLMNLKTLDWDEELLAAFEIPRAMLPEVRSSSEETGYDIAGDSGRAVAGILGDQQAALVGQACFHAGEVKNTYGTGCFLLMNTGERMVASTCGLLTTVAYKLGNKGACYALEGSVALLAHWCNGYETTLG